MSLRLPARRALFFLVVAVQSLCPQSPTSPRQPGESPKLAEPPNIIVIFVDDQGYGDLGCYGSPNIETPHIDRMAAEGIRLTSFYAAPVCGPSRAQLMTGCYPPRVSHGRNQDPVSTAGLHPNEITLAEILKATGYATLHVGKWHLGHVEPFLPTRQGFDGYFGIPYSNDMWRYHPKMPVQENEDALMRYTRERTAYTGYSGQGEYYKPGKGFSNDLALMRDEVVIEQNPDQRQLTARYTAESLKFIEREKDGPFFLYLAHNMPHVPLFVSDKFSGKSSRGLYGDVLLEIDWSTGEILRKLKELGIDEKTLVVYTSDNGPWMPYGIDAGSAGPLRGSKGSTDEGGIRVPGIFRWPGRLPAGRRSDAVASTLDFLPTFASLAGAEVPADRRIDGKNLWPLLSGQTETSPHDHFFYFGGGRMNLRGVRDARWKLTVHIAADGGDLRARALYDLGRDVSERFNRLEDHPEIAKGLQAAAQRFYDEISRNVRPLGRLGDL